ncbi:hypothetical protein ACH5RR_008777 [Cinchona calisaya]|uniref:DUF4283 domain-containing protein n=1 Tax=Cinchona calisaya TaxID=153742 RepID=A0ABD3AG82_9GENT
MRTLKWTPDFRPNIESPVVPSWIVFIDLPVVYFVKIALFSIAQLVGNPLKIDISTATINCQNVAWVCIECNLTKPMPTRVYVVKEDDRVFCQKNVYNDFPSYCSNCYKVSHIMDECQLNNSPIQCNQEPSKRKTVDKQEKVWKPKLHTSDAGASGLITAKKSIIPTLGADSNRGSKILNMDDAKEDMAMVLANTLTKEDGGKKDSQTLAIEVA